MNNRTRVTDLFSREEITLLTHKSDLMGASAVGFTWAVIGLTFAGVALSWPYLNIGGKLVVCILALIILAGRQLALGILTHDAAHSSLFKTQWMNDVLVDWLCARPVWNNLHNYRPYHLKHHAKTSTPDDPDLALVAGLPTTKASLIRKFSRDIFGITGLKFVAGRFLMDLGFIEWTVTNEIKKIPQQGRKLIDYPISFIRNSGPAMIMNGILFSLLWASGHPELYGLWLLAYVTPFPLFIRVRSMAEHADREESSDVLKNTRTTKAGFIARALVAPINVNFHIEHHLMASVPYFRLPKMYQMLRERNYVLEAPGYFEVLNKLSSKPKENQSSPQ
jgi:fatty acid desaturase